MRRLDMASGRVSIGSAKSTDQLTFDGKTLATVHGPRWRMIIIGAGQLTKYLAQMAQGLDYQVTVCDPRVEYADSWDVPGVELKRGMPDDVVTEMNPDGHTAVVTLTHDPKLDDLALLEALKSPAFYVGAIGSKKNNEARRQRLAEFDLSQEEIDRLHGPVGLKNRQQDAAGDRDRDPRRDDRHTQRRESARARGAGKGDHRRMRDRIASD